MMKKHLILVLMLLSITSIASAQQNTFSKKYPLGKVTRDMVLLDNQITLATQKSCPIDTSVSASCSSISTFDLNGDLINTMLIDSLYPEGNDRLYFDDHFYFIGHLHGQEGALPTYLTTFETDLSSPISMHIPFSLGGVNVTEGVIGDDLHLYIYGRNYTDETSDVFPFIQKINRYSYDVIWEKIYESPQRINKVADLQWTEDGNLIILNQRDDGAGAGDPDHYDLIKLDTAGNIVNQYTEEERGWAPHSLLASSTGDIYFSSDLEQGVTFPSPDGIVNKLDADMEEVEWSLWLPSDPFTNGREYEVHDLHEAANGDILACGTTWDATDGTVLDLHGTWNGFIARISTEGELLWLKVYRHPSHLVPQTELGRYKESILRKIEETPSGEIIAVGDVGYRSLQIIELGLEEGLKRDIWLLSADSMGCIAGEECEEIIVLDGINENEANFHIGTKWTYELEYFSPPRLVPHTNEIIGLTTLNDTLAYVIDNGITITSLEYMHVSGDSIYFWDSIEERFQLNFDFSATTAYETTWTGHCYSSEIGDAFVEVDSIVQVEVQDHIVDVQYLDVSYSSAYPNMAARVYTGIGNDYTLKLGLAEDCDYNWRINKLRCFENGSEFYNFVDYPCDSVIIIVDVNEVETMKPYELYPNPSKGLVNIKGLGSQAVAYKLYDAAGRLVKTGEIHHEALYIDKAGIYFLEIDNKGLRQTMRVMILE